MCWLLSVCQAFIFKNSLISMTCPSGHYEHQSWLIWEMLFGEFHYELPIQGKATCHISTSKNSTQTNGSTWQYRTLISRWDCWLYVWVCIGRDIAEKHSYNNPMTLSNALPSMKLSFTALSHWVLTTTRKAASVITPIIPILQVRKVKFRTVTGLPHDPGL